MHYLQLALLAYLGYQGTHRDPLSYTKHSGQVQQVPWGARERRRDRGDQLDPGLPRRQ
jgi:hypothetical protein